MISVLTKRPCERKAALRDLFGNHAPEEYQARPGLKTPGPSANAAATIAGHASKVCDNAHYNGQRRRSNNRSVNNRARQWTRDAFADSQAGKSWSWRETSQPAIGEGRHRSSVEQLFSDQVRLVTVSPSGPPDYFDAVVNGELLVKSSRTPFCDAARALLDRGVDSNSWLILRHAGSETDSLRAKVGIAAKLTVKEPDRGRAHFANWNPLCSSPVASSVRSKRRAATREPAQRKNAPVDSTGAAP